MIRQKSFTERDLNLSTKDLVGNFHWGFCDIK